MAEKCSHGEDPETCLICDLQSEFKSPNLLDLEREVSEALKEAAEGVTEKVPLEYSGLPSGVALIVDLDNFISSVRPRGLRLPGKVLIEKARSFGKVLHAQAYCDFTQVDPAIVKDFYINGIRMIHCPKLPVATEDGQDFKDTVDPVFIEGVHDLLFDERVGTFIFAAGDRDYLPIVNTLRHQSRKVVILLPSHAHSLLRTVADEVVDIFSPLSAKIDELPISFFRFALPEMKEALRTDSDTAFTVEFVADVLKAIEPFLSEATRFSYLQVETLALSKRREFRHHLIGGELDIKKALQALVDGGVIVPNSKDDGVKYYVANLEHPFILLMREI